MGDDTRRTSVTRRRLLRALGATTVVAGFGTGVASAHEVQFFGCEEVWTDTHGNFAVVDTGDGYEGRRMEHATRSDLRWTHDNTFRYRAGEGERVVAFVEEDQYRGGWAGEGCTLCLNPDDCVTVDAETVLAAVDQSTLGACRGALEAGDCDVVSAPAPEEPGVPEAGAWPLPELDPRRTNAAGETTGVRADPSVAWTAEAALGLPAVADGVAYVARTAGDGEQVAAFDASDGSVAWTSDEYASVASDPVVDGGVVYALVETGADGPEPLALAAWDAGTGDRQWLTEEGIQSGVGREVLADGDHLYVSLLAGGIDVHVARLDPGTGTINWNVELTDVDVPTTQLALGHDRLFVGGESTAALDPETGDVEWAGFDFRSGQGIVVGDDVVVCAATNEPHTGRDPATGEVQWELDPQGTVEVLLDGHLYEGSTAAGVRVVDAATGDVADTLDVGLRPWAATSETLYGFAGDTLLRAVDASTGDVRWESDAAEEGFDGLRATASSVYAGRADGAGVLRLAEE